MMLRDRVAEFAALQQRHSDGRPEADENLRGGGA